MFSTVLKTKLRQYQGVFQVSLGVSVLLLSVSALGWLQTFELAAFDLMVRTRPSLDPDPRIVVLEVGEGDIGALQQWPLSDEKLAELLEKVHRQRPRIVGLDLYRDLPIRTGQVRLDAIIRAMPNLVGVEKFIGESVPASPILESLGQVALADLVLDPDSKVRRGLINIETEPKVYRVGLAAQLALSYLMEDGISPEPLPDSGGAVRLGQSTLQPIEPNSGLYRGIDTGGYQILLNYRGGRSSFERVAVRDLLNDRVPLDIFTDKIVLIGVTASSLNDNFLTPYNSSFSRKEDEMPGVYIHATLTRQLLNAAEGKDLITRDIPEAAEWFWITVWAIVGAGFTGTILQLSQRSRQIMPPSVMIVGGMSGLGGLLFAISYGVFLLGWWIPLASPMLALVLSGVVRVAYQNQVLERLASLDQLTQVANRRCFDQTLDDLLRSQQTVCLILCDVDYFKPFNDTYGHLAGDECLVKVASAIQQSVRRTDLVARYGGEEFAAILPNTHPEVAESIAERIRQQVLKLKIEHRNSDVNDYVTLSCGVTSSSEAGLMSDQLINTADQALYLAKHQGRNSVVLKLAKAGVEIADDAFEADAMDSDAMDSKDIVSE